MGESESAATAQPAPADNPFGPDAFRARMREKLAQERGETPPAPTDEDQPAPDEEVAESVDEGDPGEADDADDGEPAEEAEATPEDDADDSEADPESPDPVDEWRAKAEDAEKRARLMERDYRRKTQKIAAARRDLEGQLDVVRQQAEFLTGLASGGVQQYETLDWNSLRTNPEVYQQRRAEYDQAIRVRDQLVSNLKRIEADYQKQRETALEREAEISREILKGSLKGWGPEMYAELREFATKELAFTDDFDDISDWRVIELISREMQRHKAPKSLEQVKRKKGKPPLNRQREKNVQMRRSAKGQFQDARAALSERPNDRGAAVDFFRSKLAAERERR